MAKRTKRPFLVNMVGIIIFLSLLVCINIHYVVVINNQNHKISNEKSIVIANTYIFNNCNKENNVLTNYLLNIQSIDEKTVSIKEEYFVLAKELENKVLNKEINKKIAYLTFDDGPYYLTYQFLEVLKKYNVRATFFVIGAGKESCYDNGSANCTKLYKEITNGGHTIANHTYSHSIFYGLYSSADSFITQVKKMENYIKSFTGVTTNIVRFPGGMATSGYLKNAITSKLREMGYGWVDWTAMDGDGGSLSSTDAAWNNFTSSVNSDIEVILFHDYSNITLSILPRAIEYLKNNNYVILPLFKESSMVNK